MKILSSFSHHDILVSIWFRLFFFYRNICDFQKKTILLPVFKIFGICLSICTMIGSKYIDSRSPLGWTLSIFLTSCKQNPGSETCIYTHTAVMGQECAGMIVNWADKEGQQDPRWSHGGDHVTAWAREESLMITFSAVPAPSHWPAPAESCMYL